MINIKVAVKTLIPGDLSLKIDGVELLRVPTMQEVFDINWSHGDARQVHEFVLSLQGKRSFMDRQPTPDAVDRAINENYRIEDLRFNDINIWPLIRYTAGYHHDNNGFGPVETAHPGRDVGWDGELRFRFITPLASWMVESFPHGCWQESDN